MFYDHRNAIRPMLIWVAVLIQITVASALAADKTAVKGSSSADEKIQITADRLLSSGRENYAEFIGNVEARQGSFVIKSDSLRIYYKNLQKPSKNPVMGEESIEKIIAVGRVKIWSDDRVAETDRAEWSVTDRVIVLAGANSKIKRGENVITGSRITFYQGDGRIKVEGHNGQRVKATFYQGIKEKDNGVEKKP